MHVMSIHIGEFGIVYKAHIVKHKDGQVVFETMAVKTLKGELMMTHNGPMIYIIQCTILAQQCRFP